MSLPVGRALAGLAVLLLRAPTDGGAGTTASLPSAGDRIRVQMAAPESVAVLPSLHPQAGRPGGDRIVGALVASREGTIIVQPEDGSAQLAVPVRSISRFEVSRGWHGHASRGAWIGALVGGVGGATAGFILCASENCESSGVDHESLWVAAVLGAGGAVVGTGFGALVGSLIRSERWDAVPPEGFQLGLVPPGGSAFGIRVCLRWDGPS